MRLRGRVRTAGCALATLLLASAAHAQAADGPQRLVIWVVSSERDPHPLAKPGMQVAGTWNPQYQEQTAGSFGQTAGSVGQTAGSTGTTTGSFGQTAGSTGQTAGSTGQTAGSFGRSASATGKNAGDAGTTMANFGVSTTNLAGAAAAANALTTASQTPRRDERWSAFLEDVRRQMRGVEVIVDDVYGNDLEALLLMAQGTANAPDVLVGSPLPREWTAQELAGRFGMSGVWNASRAAMAEEVTTRYGFFPQAALVAGAPDRAQAREFGLWFWNRGASEREYTSSPKTAPLADMAERAVKAMLAGGSVGDGDAQMAQVSAQVAAEELFGAGAANPGPFDVKTETTGLRVFSTLAVAAVRAEASGERVYGVAHAVVVLRKGVDGRWRVLQVSANLTAEAQNRAVELLTKYLDGTARAGEEGSAALVNEGPKMAGVMQASPKDGETRPPQPELWWDNLGGASLEVVEWQHGSEGWWSASHLFFVPDNNSRLRTRVTARFASAAGVYRWRVWSVQKGGAVVVGTWRTMTIMGR